MASTSKPSSKRDPLPFTLPPHISHPSNSSAKPGTQPHLPLAADVVSPSPEETAFARSSHLSLQELLRRRYRHRKQLSKVYRDYYWAFMEEARVQYRDYYWRFGVSPYKEDEEREVVDREREKEMGGSWNVEGSGETNININSNSCSLVGSNVNGVKSRLGVGEGSSRFESKLGGNNRCASVGCKLKAMALTSFCQLHILSDPHQKLYKACNYVIKSAQAGPIVCGKPILRSSIPSLCNIHFQKAQKHVNRALKKAGLNGSSSNKLAPKFHVIVAEYVCQIQAKRRAAQKPSSSGVVIKEENVT